MVNEVEVRLVVLLLVEEVEAGAARADLLEIIDADAAVQRVRARHELALELRHPALYAPCNSFEKIVDAVQSERGERAIFDELFSGELRRDLQRSRVQAADQLRIHRVENGANPEVVNDRLRREQTAAVAERHGELVPRGFYEEERSGRLL